MPRKKPSPKRLNLLEWSACPVVRPRGARRGSRVAARGTARFRMVGETRQPGDLDRVIETRLGKLLTERLRSFDGLPGRFNELATEVRLGLKHDFAQLGIDLVDFTILAMEAGTRRSGSARRAPRGASARNDAKRPKGTGKAPSRTAAPRRDPGR